LEYLDGGEVKWQVSQEEPKPVMTQDVARKVFRDVISGVGYRKYIKLLIKYYYYHIIYIISIK